MNRTEGFTRLEQISKHIDNADRHKFFCLSCKCDITSIVYDCPHDGKTHSVPCPRCGRTLKIDSTRLSAVMLMNTKRHRKWSPELGSGIVVPDRQTELIT